MYDILSGSVKMTNIYGALLTEVNTDSMPVWQQLMKRTMDIVFSMIAILLLLPVYTCSGHYGEDIFSSHLSSLLKKELEEMVRNFKSSSFEPWS